MESGASCGTECGPVFVRSIDMKHWILTVALLLCGMAASEAQVRFETCSTDELRELAVRSGKRVFIDLYASWCGPCRQMERDVFSQRAVGEFFDRRFVAAKYSVDRSTGRQLMQRYGNGAIPLYLIFDTEGNLLGRIEGAAPAEKFLAELQRILDKHPAEKGK